MEGGLRPAFFRLGSSDAQRHETALRYSLKAAAELPEKRVYLDMPRLQSLAYCTVLMLIAGWLLYIGKDVFVPVFFGAVVAYVIVGLVQALLRIPYLGRALSLRVRYMVSVLGIALALFGIAFLAVPITAILAIVLSEFSATRPVAVLFSKNGSL